MAKALSVVETAKSKARSFAKWAKDNTGKIADYTFSKGDKKGKTEKVTLDNTLSSAIMLLLVNCVRKANGDEEVSEKGLPTAKAIAVCRAIGCPNSFLPEHTGKSKKSVDSLLAEMEEIEESTK